MKLNFIKATRQNHALEHATIAILVKRLGTNLKLLGRSTPSGFYIYGNIPTNEIEKAAAEGLSLLKQGNTELAISALCGTNMVVAGVMTGLASILVLGKKNRLQRLPQVILASLFAIIISQPIGRLVQEHWTTSADLANLNIKQITKKGKGTRTVHKVETYCS